MARATYKKNCYAMGVDFGYFDSTCVYIVKLPGKQFVHKERFVPVDRESQSKKVILLAEKYDAFVLINFEAHESVLEDFIRHGLHAEQMNFALWAKKDTIKQVHTPKNYDLARNLANYGGNYIAEIK